MTVRGVLGRFLRPEGGPLDPELEKPGFVHAERVARAARPMLSVLFVAVVLLLTPVGSGALLTVVVLGVAFVGLVHVTATRSTLVALRWARGANVAAAGFCVLMVLGLLSGGPATSRSSASAPEPPGEVSSQLRAAAYEAVGVLGTSPTAWADAAAGRAAGALPPELKILAAGPSGWWRIAYAGELGCLPPSDPQKIRRSCPVMGRYAAQPG